MNNDYKKAETLLKKVVEDLGKLIEQDGENIECYNYSALNESIEDLIEAKVYMAKGRV